LISATGLEHNRSGGLEVLGVGVLGGEKTQSQPKENLFEANIRTTGQEGKKGGTAFHEHLGVKGDGSNNPTSSKRRQGCTKSKDPDAKKTREGRPLGDPWCRSRAKPSSP